MKRVSVSEQARHDGVHLHEIYAVERWSDVPLCVECRSPLSDREVEDNGGYCQHCVKGWVEKALA